MYKAATVGAALSFLGRGCVEWGVAGSVGGIADRAGRVESEEGLVEERLVREQVG